MLLHYSLQVLIIESSANDVEALLNDLRRGGSAISSRRVLDGPELQSALREREWDLLLCATEAQDLTFQEAAAGLADANVDIPVVVIYDAVADDHGRRVVESLRLGACDAVDKSNAEHLELVLGREIAHLTERRAARQWRNALDERERHWHGLLEASRDPIAYVHGGMHIHANPTYLDMFGFDNFEELEGLPVLDLVVQSDHARFKDFIRDDGERGATARSIEIGGLRLDGNRIDIRVEISPGTFESEACWQMVIRDQTNNEEIHRQLEYLRHHDPLTGLHNRQHFIDKLDAAIAGQEDGEPRGYALLYVELDNFNVLRETTGIAGSDNVIAQVAGLFRERIPRRYLLSRFGDSIFTVLAEAQSLRAAAEVGERLRACLDERTLEVDGVSVSTTCSVGVSSIGQQARGSESVLAQAQRLARAARKEGGNRIEIKLITSPPVNKRAAMTTGTSPLGDALENGKLKLMYQPIINLREASMELYEVTLGHTDERGELVVGDNLFHPDLEAALLHRLDEWVVEHAITYLAQQMEAGRDTHFFVKLSEHALHDEQMLLSIGKKLRAAQLPGDHLILQISEAAAVTQVRSVKAFIKGLREIQCLAALQDFGTGLNSLNALKTLDVAYFKIDSALVQTLATNSESQSAVRAIVETARSLNKRAIAAGVDEAATLAMLWDLGVHYAQGDGISAPSSELEWDFEASEIGEL